jgi:hypothetical protein
MGTTQPTSPAIIRPAVTIQIPLPCKKSLMV